VIRFPLVRLAQVALVALAATAGCTRHLSPVEHGAALAADPAFSAWPGNAFSCASCHAARPADSPRLMPGAPLAGSTLRPSFWGAAVLDLFEAVSVCYRRFMRGGALDRDSDDSRALYAYLDSLLAGGAVETGAVAFTPVRTSAPPAAGDPSRGGALFGRACAPCHGQPRSGAGRVGDSSVLPDQTERAHARAQGYTVESMRQVFVQKIRSGGYLGFDGVMPPFSREVLSDADVADIIAHLDPQLR
jgi:thiosulfate dehydrogenase